MAKRVQKIVESIVYVGMKPGDAKSQGKPRRWLRSLGAPLERFLSGTAPSDPLYLSNRTSGQKAKRAALILVPLVLVVGGLFAALNVFAPKPAPPPQELTSAEIAAKMLPDFGGLQVETNKDLEVMEVHFERNRGSVLAGTVRNTTDRLIREGEVVFDVTDSKGSQLGGVSVKFSNLAAGAATKFAQPIEQTSAVFALVREVHSR